MMVVQSMADMFECSNNLAPLGSARGALGFAQTVRRAKPRREIQCIYLHPSASLGVQPSALIGVQCSAPLKLFVERSRDEKSNAYTPTPRLRSGCTRLCSGCPRLRSGCNARLRSGCTRLCSGCNHSSPIGLTSLLLLWSY